MPDKDRVSRFVLSLTLFMFLLALANVMPVSDLERLTHQSIAVISEPERRGMLLAGTPHGPIAIDGDADFSDTALLEGWPGDGSPENPYIIDGLDIDLGDVDGDCIRISNTRVYFAISNCKLTGASTYAGAGIYLTKVTNGELVHNTCNNNRNGIHLHDSDSNTVVNNTCNNNDYGMSLFDSDSNTVTDNTCNSNIEHGLYLYVSDYNTVSDNTCTSNAECGIYLRYSDYSTVSDNTCNSNWNGIYLQYSDYNTVSDNTCEYNWIGIYLYDSHGTIMVNNACWRNTEHGIFQEFETEEFDPFGLLVIGFVVVVSAGVVVVVVANVIGITLLGRGRIVAKRASPVPEGRASQAYYVRRLTEEEGTEAYRAARLAEEGRRIAYDKGDVDVPTVHRLKSWLRRRRPLKHKDVDESLEPDSSDQ